MDLTKIPERRRKEFLLVQAAQKGDEQAFTKLFDMYYKTIYYTVLKLVKNEQDAEDLTLEAFTKAFENIQYYVPTHAFLTWLSKIAVNRSIDFLRKNKNSNMTYSMDEPHPQAEDENASLKFIIQSQQDDPEDDFIKNETNQILYNFIDKLPHDYAEILKLRFFGLMSYKEIAKKLKLPLGTVKARIHRGKELLRSLMNNKKDFFK